MRAESKERLATWRRAVKNAERRVSAMDQADTDFGLASPSDLGPIEIMRTAASAIEAWAATGDISCIADAFVMLKRGGGR